MGWIVRLNGKGRIVIPREVREKLGLMKGNSLVLDIKGDEIVLTLFPRKSTKGGKEDNFLDFLSR